MFSSEVIRSIAAAARDARLEPAALLAIAHVESAGKPFAIVGGRPEPIIRFEGHYFDRRLAGAKRAQARAAGLASPKAGAVANPRTQAARWQLLARAEEIDRKAARESVSWGIGQVMGAHWAWLGYASVDALMEAARSGVEGQITLMLRYVEKAGLLPALKRRDWKTFAKGYNGPQYAKYAYDRKMAAAYTRYAAANDGEDTVQETPGSRRLARGMRGTHVLELQRLLIGAGALILADGIFGPLTEQALRSFQQHSGLAVDGIAGPETMSALRRHKQIAQPPGLWARFLSGIAAWLGRD